MKTIVMYSFTLMLALTVLLALPTHGEEQIYEDVLRLHVLANSDSEEDQALKLAVRDEILTVYGTALSDTGSKEAAAAAVTELLPQIEKTAADKIRSLGYDYSVSVFLDTEHYTTRVYGDLTLPAGEYLSLRIVIGEGAGQNWWCVLYPPLCLSLATGDDSTAEDSVPVGLTPQEYRLISDHDGQYVLKFKTLEWLEKCFR